MAKSITIKQIKEVFANALDKATGLSLETKEMTELIINSQFVAEVTEFGETKLTAFNHFDDAERFLEEIRERNDTAKIRLYDLNKSYMFTDGDLFLETAY